jgi:hypothetical protein
MPSLPPLSGSDCVRALLRAGFTLACGARPAATFTQLTKDHYFVQVPDVPLVDPLVLGEILRAAGLSEERFFVEP